MLEKREPKYENSSKKWSKNGAKIRKNDLQKSIAKIAKIDAKKGAAVSRRTPQFNIKESSG